ncbi:hypothetical protein CDL12_28136 [Handroanthus impetiginosus]|uniref:Cell wall protein n=1 Tax=Handroanthus impetiginosus TaxID=429701 RepID=A0A2G9G380_9LAMI|nr:hypothetical protein CDL12_28136 [Handroanthus impetiginosus]
MASINPQTLLFTFLFFFAISATMEIVSGRNIPADTKAEPQWFGHFDRSVLIPGIGRVMVPKKGTHGKDWHYNPITGSPGGHGIGGSTGAGSPRSYIPGGDDTFLPNPGVEVPNPVGGGIPAPSGH